MDAHILTARSAVKRVEIAIERSNLQQAETAQLLSKLVGGLALVLPSTNPPPFEFAADDGSLNCNFNLPFHSPKEVRSTTNHPSKAAEEMTRNRKRAVKVAEPDQAMQIYSKKSKVLCKEWCSCACHQKRVLRVKQPFSTAVGSVSLAYSGLPWITPECDQKSCASRSVPSIAMTVQFPAWFWRRYLSSSFTYTPIRGPEINLKLPRTVDWTCKLWKLGVEGNLRAIQQLFSTGQASPWDTSPLGGSVLHVSILLFYDFGVVEIRFPAEHFRHTVIASLLTDATIILVRCRSWTYQALQVSSGRRCAN